MLPWARQLLHRAGRRKEVRLGRAVLREASRDRLSLVAAGVAFYALLAAFPGLAGLVALYGLVFDSAQVTQQIAALEGLLPPQALELVLVELRALTGAGRQALGWGAAGALALTLWSASRGIKTLMEALNVAYDERESRGFLRRNALALGLTLAAIACAALSIATVVLLPALVRFVGLGALAEGLIVYARWPIVAVAVGLGIAVIYRYGPSRERPAWALVAWGAVLASGLWLSASALFSFYVSTFGGFSATYGSIAAFAILLMWFLLSAYAVLLGAELNAVLERRGARESTLGPAQA